MLATLLLSLVTSYQKRGKNRCAPPRALVQLDISLRVSAMHTAQFVVSNVSVGDSIILVNNST